jgi:metallo-beta-lactamase superfamily protein
VEIAVAARHLVLMTLATPTTTIPGLHASEPEPLPFAPSLQIRSYRLEREAGDLLIYSTTTSSGSPWRQYLGHGHEAGFAAAAVNAPLFVHAADRAAVEQEVPVRAAFSRRHMLDDDFEVIPIPGHTPGSTAYLWDSGAHRFLFTGDSVWLDHGEWSAVVLDAGARQDYLGSLALVRELDFDVLVPWGATQDEPYIAVVSRSEARERLGAIIERVEAGGDR